MIVKTLFFDGRISPKAINFFLSGFWPHIFGLTSKLLENISKKKKRLKTREEKDKSKHFFFENDVTLTYL